MQKPDFIFIVYHNPVIINHIMEFHEYDITSNLKIIMISEVFESIDEQILAQEYIEFVQRYK